MKKIIFILSTFMLIFQILSCKKNDSSEKNLKSTITISGAFALYPMTVKWAEEYKKEYPNIKIDISAGGAGKGMTDALSGFADIGMVSREIYKEEIDKGAFPVSVTKDAVVAVISSKNPYADKILKKGITKDLFENIWITKKIKYWDELFGEKNKNILITYTRSDACGAGDTWAKYLGDKKQEDLQGVGVYGDPGINEAVKNDVFGIGYSNIGYAYDMKTGLATDGIIVVPIDLNGNGKIDNDENFYSHKSDLLKAVVENKFPSPPAKVLYFVTHNKPQKNTLSFIKWVLTKGQSFVDEAGYIKLTDFQIKNELKKL